MNVLTPRLRTQSFVNISSKVVLRSVPASLLPDAMLGSYRIVQQIGVGGMATVSRPCM